MAMTLNEALKLIDSMKEQYTLISTTCHVDQTQLTNLRDFITDNLSAQAKVLDDTASFKNFHRSLCERFSYTHDEKDWRRDLVSLEEHIARISRCESLSDDAMRDEWRSSGGFIHGPHTETVTMPEADYFRLRRSFAARLSQGAQGEAAAEVDELDCETGPGVPCITMLGPMPPIGTKLYTHPAERSAVPDEVLRKAESLRNGIHAASCRMPEGWADVAVDWQRDAQAILDWLTAVPQPPEGARVVDGWQPIESAPTDGTPHVRGLWVRTPRGSYFDAVVGGINDEGEFVDLDHDSTRWDASDYTHWHRLSAAPALAGKEGVK